MAGLLETIACMAAHGSLPAEPILVTLHFAGGKSITIGYPDEVQRVVTADDMKAGTVDAIPLPAKHAGPVTLDARDSQYWYHAGEPLLEVKP